MIFILYYSIYIRIRTYDTVHTYIFCPKIPTVRLIKGWQVIIGISLYTVYVYMRIRSTYTYTVYIYVHENYTYMHTAFFQLRNSTIFTPSTASIVKYDAGAQWSGIGSLRARGNPFINYPFWGRYQMFCLSRRSFLVFILSAIFDVFTLFSLFSIMYLDFRFLAIFIFYAFSLLC